MTLSSHKKIEMFLTKTTEIEQISLKIRRPSIDARQAAFYIEVGINASWDFFIGSHVEHVFIESKLHISKQKAGSHGSRRKTFRRHSWKRMTSALSCFCFENFTNSKRGELQVCSPNEHEHDLCLCVWQRRS